MAAVTICSNFGAQKIKSDTVSTVSPSISCEMMGPDAYINAQYTCRLYAIYTLEAYILTFKFLFFYKKKGIFSFFTVPNLT